MLMHLASIVVVNAHQLHKLTVISQYHFPAMTYDPIKASVKNC